MAQRKACLVLSLLLVFVAIAEATPPGIANNPSHASCNKKEFKQCYNLVHVCPKFCPDGVCHVHCASCKPICGPDTSAPEKSPVPAPPTVYPPPPPTQPLPTPSPPIVTPSPPPPTPVVTPSPPPPTPVVTPSPPPPTEPPPTPSPPPPTPTVTPSPPPPTQPPPTSSPPIVTPSPPPTPIVTPSPPPPTQPPSTPSHPIVTPSPPPPTPSVPSPTPPTVTPSPPPPPTETPPSPTPPTVSPSPAPVPPTPSLPPLTPPSLTPPPPLIPSSPSPPLPTVTPSPPPPSQSPPTPTPPSPPSKAKCLNKKYHACYKHEFTCPDSCPGACEADCVTCKPVCNCDKPGAVCQDPRFIGGDGIAFYFHGKKNHDFCLVSDSNVHINAHFIGKRNQNMGRDFTWVQSIAVLFDNHQLVLGALRTSTWHDRVDRLRLIIDGEHLNLPETSGAKWQLESAPGVSITRASDTNSVIIEVEGNFKITAKVVPITEEDSRIHNYGITKDNCFAHLDLGFKFYSLSNQVNGVLGQTYKPGYMSRVNIGAKMAVMGGDRLFETSSLFSPDCVVARFSGSNADESSNYLELPGLSCGSGMDGEGVVCKR